MGILSIQQRLYPLLEGGFYTWDIVENTFWADRRYAKIMGVDYSDVDQGLPAESFLETVHQDDRAGVIERMKMTAINRQPFETTYGVKREDTFALVKDYGQCMRSVDGYATLFTGIVFEVLGQNQTRRPATRTTWISNAGLQETRCSSANALMRNEPSATY